MLRYLSLLESIFCCEELDRLEQQKVIEPVQMSEWAAPIVPVMKPDGSIRICGDYKLTINQAAKPDVYPLPRVEDLFATLAGGKFFSKLDLAQAYQHTQRVVQIQSTTFWCYCCPFYISGDHGEPPARHSTCIHLFR